MKWHMATLEVSTRGGPTPLLSLPLAIVFDNVAAYVFHT